MTPSRRVLRDLDVAYTRFNAGRSLGASASSEFRIVEVGGAIALIDAARPRNDYVNRVLAFGPGSLPELPRLLAPYEESGIEPRVDLEPDAITLDVSDALFARGFRPAESLSYLTGALEPSGPAARSPRPSSGNPSSPMEPPTVERWGVDRVDDFLGLLATSGVACDPAVWSDRRRHYCTDSFRAYVASLEGAPRAWATLFVLGRAAYLANAYTQPEWRNRGCQTVLLRARLADAAALGFDWVMTDVEHGSSSHANSLRAGLTLATVATMWRRTSRL